MLVERLVEHDTVAGKVAFRFDQEALLECAVALDYGVCYLAERGLHERARKLDDLITPIREAADRG